MHLRAQRVDGHGGLTRTACAVRGSIVPTLIAVILSVMPARPGRAQDLAYGYSVLGASTLSNLVAGTGSRAVRQRAEREAAAQGGKGDGSTSKRRATLRYHPSAALARSTVAGYIDRLARSNPAAARALAEQLGRFDYRDAYRSVVRPFGLGDTSPADSLTAYTVLAWMIAAGAADPNARDVTGALRQFDARLADNPQLMVADNAAQLGEEFKLLFVILHGGWQSARREGTLQQYSDGVAAMFLKQGTDLRALRLTEQGLVPK